ncbi:hypothetical protein SDC9_146147 [bioreactor metagenome]|uniref:Uncharacterized protein n=1 Tax=bioreactor metagenome TaxID=1076179 RepID=A0A645EAI1_9ZZZZ
MRKLWLCDDWNTLICSNSRHDIRLRFDSDVDVDVKRACKEFINWLRLQYTFPIRVPIYLKNSMGIKSKSGEIVSATFFGPFDKSLEPYIKIAVGDYEILKKEMGKDNALASILHSIAHELSHYFQWIKNYDFLEAKFEKQAKYYASEILFDYADTRDHP